MKNLVKGHVCFVAFSFANQGPYIARYQEHFYHLQAATK